ncbi:sulfatase-like hydrolase/transferase [Roseimicrobium sp. ORNL1]|uniref:sulfatase-like hydrolase/transferase n=1 Tax=Roseimicrobium sp. ORNL1 TaxID=2711231 RepID=UPI0013E174FB|nr:sulfatase-like hydrolase/transferase [Roseimicrobium sp. ORNL1]QIF01604.1 sulfatase-like hydrolase/transferase [Roseimicrobium sp. ORNL1]
MTTRTFLLLAALICLSVTQRLGAADRPNILWLTTEDIGPDLGCYGDAYAVTPNLDAFAKRSQLFQHAWSNAPVCAPARTTIISGMYPTSTGGEHMRSSVPLPEGVKMYPQMLREAGYYCTNNSKEDYNLQKTKTTEGKDAVWDASGKNAHWKNRGKDQPFFAIFNFTETHESQIRQPGHKLVHDPAKAQVPPYHPDTPESRHDWAQYADNITEMDGLFAEKLKEMEDAGLAEDTIVFFYGDHGAGMPRHKRWPYNSGLRVPFIVHFPKKWEHLAPKGYAPGAKSEELISFVDLSPTLLSIIGQPAPDYLQGRAFCGSHAKPAPAFLFGFRGRMDERQDLVRSVTDGRYVYLRQYMPHLPYGQHINYMMQMPTAQVWKKAYDEGRATPEQAMFWKPTKPVEELYDLQSDPHEVKNLAEDPASLDTLIKLRAAHRKQMKDTRDIGFIPEAERLRLSGDRSPRDVFASDDAYDFDFVFASASAASDNSDLVKDAKFHMSGLKLIDPPKSERKASATPSAVRYWGAIGLHIRGAEAVKQGRDALVTALKDESPSVRIAAANALATYGNDEDSNAALQVLLADADATKTSNATAMEALSALGNHVEKLKSMKDKVAALPDGAKGTEQRLKEYVPRLKEKLSVDLGIPIAKSQGGASRDGL